MCAIHHTLFLYLTGMKFTVTNVCVCATLYIFSCTHRFSAIFLHFHVGLYIQALVCMCMCLPLSAYMLVYLCVCVCLLLERVHEQLRVFVHVCSCYPSCVCVCCLCALCEWVRRLASSIRELKLKGMCGNECRGAFMSRPIVQRQFLPPPLCCSSSFFHLCLYFPLFLSTLALSHIQLLPLDHSVLLNSKNASPLLSCSLSLSLSLPPFSCLFSLSISLCFV